MKFFCLKSCTNGKGGFFAEGRVYTEIGDGPWTIYFREINDQEEKTLNVAAQKEPEYLKPVKEDSQNDDIEEVLSKFRI